MLLSDEKELLSLRKNEVIGKNISIDCLFTGFMPNWHNNEVRLENIGSQSRKY